MKLKIFTLPGLRTAPRLHSHLIAIDDYGSIYIMDADGSNQTRLTAGVAVSPDGTRIAFVTNL